MKIAIQGGRASFHDIAARKYFNEEIETVKCRTFRQICTELVEGKVDYSLMAIENSIAGSILPNYSLLKEHNLFICGEYKMQIHQNLMALPGQKIENLHKVMSHYMALSQCREFLDPYTNIELEEFHDTADSAKEIFEKNLKGVGAIAGDYAAEIYGLEILAHNIETIPENYTRFLVLRKDKKIEGVCNKATINFELPNQVGSLAKTLQTVVDYGINLTKIQSIPIIGRPDQYTFYADCTWENSDQMRRCFITLRDTLPSLDIMGEYTNFEIEL